MNDAHSRSAHNVVDYQHQQLFQLQKSIEFHLERITRLQAEVASEEGELLRCIQIKRELLQD